MAAQEADVELLELAVEVGALEAGAVGNAVAASAGTEASARWNLAFDMISDLPVAMNRRDRAGL